MELMFIVWLVSVLSNLKLFVSGYTTLCVVVVLVIYLASKLNFHEVVKAIRNRTNLPEISEGQTLEITTSLLGVAGLNLPAGTYKVVHVYPNPSRVCLKDLEHNEDYYANLLKLRSQLSPEEATDSSQKPISWPCSKPIRLSGYVAAIMVASSVLLPSDTTMKYMAGAYLLQTAYESETGKRVVSVGSRAIELQLNRWAQESPDLEALVQSAQSAAEAVK